MASSGVTDEGPRVTLHMLLKAMIDKGASDLHISTGTPPLLRIDGRLVALRTPPLSPVETQELCFSALSDSQKRAFERDRELDFSFGVRGLSRFRANYFRQRGGVAAAIRTIPFETTSLETLGTPPVLKELARRPRGLILITGPTGSGKSTTLAAVVDLINNERYGHIITIEDPIEHLHPHKSCLVNQREVGTDTESFGAALKYVLRQDPDVVLIGEIRDLETVEAAMTISETGHLTFATMHTNSAVQTINRIIDIFPPHQQSQVRAQLSFSLEAVLCQQLIPKVGGGRALAVELMIATPAIRNLIREDKVHQIYTQMQMGQGKSAMRTMNQSLLELVNNRQIRSEDAIEKSSDPDELRSLLLGQSANGGSHRSQVRGS